MNSLYLLHAGSKDVKDIFFALRECAGEYSGDSLKHQVSVPYSPFLYSYNFIFILEVHAILLQLLHYHDVIALLVCGSLRD